jgi:CRP/FNR family transcriptional regulator, anaerobic regulatory protein
MIQVISQLAAVPSDLTRAAVPLLLRNGDEMIASLLNNRLAIRLHLGRAEIAFLESLESRSVEYARHRSIRRAGDPAGEAFVLKTGWAMSFSQFRDGSRQVRRLHFPGDLIAMPSLAMRHHAEDLEALSDVVVSPFERREFAVLFERFPGLAGLMFMFAQSERITSGDRLATLGRESAKARMAFMLLDILNRLRLIDESVIGAFRMHLTREQMADVTGITPVHASRMWSELKADGLIRCEGDVVEIVDEPRLAALSGYVNRADDLDFSWLPDGTADDRPSSLVRRRPDYRPAAAGGRG